jgi:hypothetical protein
MSSGSASTVLTSEILRFAQDDKTFFCVTEHFELRARLPMKGFFEEGEGNQQLFCKEVISFRDAIRKFAADFEN